MAPAFHTCEVSVLTLSHAGISSLTVSTQVTSCVVLYHSPCPCIGPRTTLQQDLARWTVVIWPHLSKFHGLALSTSSPIPTHLHPVCFLSREARQLELTQTPLQLCPGSPGLHRQLLAWEVVAGLW